MSAVWEFSRFGGVKLLLLLAIADHANDEGIAYPGILRLAKKIRRSKRQTQLLLQKVLDARPRELLILESGGAGSRYDKGHLYQVVVKPHRNGLTTQLKALREKKQVGGEENNTPYRPARGGEENNTRGVRKSSGEGRGNPHPRGEETLTLTIIEPSINHPTTATAAAAADDVGNGVWGWSGLGAASKLTQKRLAELTDKQCEPAAFVGLYLYGLCAPRIQSPGLWASKHLADSPANRAGQPFDLLARGGPAQLAAVCAWLRDGGPLPDLADKFVQGAALGWRGQLTAKYKNSDALEAAITKTINELGLTALAAAPEPPAPPVDDLPAEPAPILDPWQKMLANGLRAEFGDAIMTRLQRCQLMDDHGDAGLVVGVPSPHDWDWLSRMAAENLKKWHRVTLVRV